MYVMHADGCALLFHHQAHHLRCLNDFVDAQAAYYAQCYQYMVNLQKREAMRIHVNVCFCIVRQRDMLSEVGSYFLHTGSKPFWTPSPSLTISHVHIIRADIYLWYFGCNKQSQKYDVSLLYILVFRVLFKIKNLSILQKKISIAKSESF